MKGRIAYDLVHWQGESYKTGLIHPAEETISADLEDSYYPELHTHYMLITYSDPRMLSRIKQRTYNQLGSIAEQTTIAEGKNCEFWRVSSQENRILKKKEIFNGEWVREPRLHEMKSQAVSNLIQKLESSASS